MLGATRPLSQAASHKRNTNAMQDKILLCYSCLLLPIYVDTLLQFK